MEVSEMHEVEELLNKHNFDSAGTLCDKILTNEPNDGYAYMYKLLCDLRTPDFHSKQLINYKNNPNFKKALKCLPKLPRDYLFSLDNAELHYEVCKKIHFFESKAKEAINKSDFRWAMWCFLQIAGIDDCNAIKRYLICEHLVKEDEG